MGLSRHVTGCAAVFALLVAHALAAQQSPPVLQLAQAEQLAESEPETALALLSDLVSGLSDPRMRFDALLLRAQVLADLGQTDEAARLYLQLSGIAADAREQFGRGPEPLLDRAAVLFDQADNLRGATRALQALLRSQQDGGRGGRALAQTYRRLEALMRKADRGAEAERYSTLALTALQVVGGARSGSDTGGFRVVDVFYATDRARSGAQDPDAYYSGLRGSLELGIAQVTIPDTHKPGVLEAPSIWRLEFGPNPAKHLVLHSITPVARNRFFAKMRGRLQEIDSKDAFVFVHGYNVRFDAAAKRAAQIAHDMDFQGVPVLYSWPSRGSTGGYIADTAVVRLSGRRLSGFLDDLVAQSGARTIHIVGHSMGNRALTDALELMALRRGAQPGDAPVFDQILFAAPDVDAELFAAMMPTIRPLAKRLTLYASNEDWALATSRQLHGDAPRAGQGGDAMIARAEFDSVDMSELGEDMLAHSYFADDSSALADMVALFWRNADPAQRCGLQRTQREGQIAPIWLFTPGPCADANWVEVMAHLRNADVTELKDAEDVVARTVTDPQKASAFLPVLSRLLSD